MFEQSARLLDKVSTDSAMLAICFRKTQKGQLAPEELGKEWSERMERMIDNIQAVNDITCGRKG